MSTFDNMVNFLDQAWNARSYIVPCLIGPVGIGKTDAVYQHANNIGAKNVVTIIVSQILPNEVSGITMPDTDTKAMEIYDHFKLGHLQDGDILFFDELLEGDQYVLSACLTLIESRMLMSGKKLPDIQIIAACNPTIKPNMLKASIRQRFLFKKFDIDIDGCHKYLLNTYNVNIPTSFIAKNLVSDDNNEYNFLSQRTLTKLVKWFIDTPQDQYNKLANTINDMFNSSIGTSLNTYINDSKDSISEMYKAIRDTCISYNVGFRDIEEAGTLLYEDSNIGLNMADAFSSENIFRETNLEEFINTLRMLPEWDAIEKKLNTIQIEDEKDVKIEF